MYLPIDSLNTHAANIKGTFFALRHADDFGACAHCYWSTPIDSIALYVTDAHATQHTIPYDSIITIHKDTVIIHFNTENFSDQIITLDSIIYKSNYHQELQYITPRDSLNILERQYYDCDECGSV